jgi:RNA polymerase sigma-70 factor (ECF subfamily)
VVDKPQSTNEDVAQRWTECLPAVAAFVRSMTRNFHDAQDILQEVSMVVVRKYSDYDKSRPFIAWVIGIARHEVMAYRRQLSVESRVMDDVAVEQIAQAFVESREHLNPLAEALEECIKRVSEKARRLLRLRYIDDLPYAQIARATGANPTSIKVAMHRIRVGLMNCVERHPAAREEP